VGEVIAADGETVGARVAGVGVVVCVATTAARAAVSAGAMLAVGIALGPGEAGI
jgi:hypothetical protein